MTFSFKALPGLVVATILTGAMAQAQDTTTTTTTTPAAPQNLAGFVLPSTAQLAALKGMCASCKEKICSCCIGQLLGNLTLPLSMMTGGCIKPCCPPVKESDLKAPADSAAGACARITKDQMEMEQRRKAVRCLARADCNWYPEAQLALINALRTDKAECVRLEAARVLTVGCCGTKKVIDALTICVNAGTKDGNPPENSPRVREMALVALQKALECYVEREEPQRPEVPGLLPAPRPTPEKKESPMASPEEKPMVRPASADAADDTAAVIAAAIKTLKQSQGGLPPTETVSPANFTQMKPRTQEQAGTIETTKFTKTYSPRETAPNGEPSELVLSRAMVAVQNGKAAIKEKSESAKGQPRTQRNLTSIFSNAFKGPSQPREKAESEEKTAR